MKIKVYANSYDPDHFIGEFEMDMMPVPGDEIVVRDKFEYRVIRRRLMVQSREDTTEVAQLIVEAVSD